MSEDQRLPYEAGPEMNDKVHRLVFGDPKPADELEVFEWPTPLYSERINFAWDLVVELRTLGWLVRVQEMPEGFPYYLDWIDVPNPRTIDRRVLALVGKPLDLSMTEGRGYANDAPLAICRAIVDTSTRMYFRGFRNAQS